MLALRTLREKHAVLVKQNGADDRERHDEG
jgi:hypothetical protein